MKQISKAWLTVLMLARFLGLGTPFAAVGQTQAQIGNLSIEASLNTQTTFNLNRGMVRQSTASYRVLHKGKPVRLRDAKGQLHELRFWQAWTLPDAARPAILAANRATYLITEEAGELQVQLLRGAYHDAATWQWMDLNGRIGESHSVYIQDRVQGPYELRGGQTLAVSARVLLDVKTLTHVSLDTEGDSVKLAQAQGYSAGSNTAILMYSGAAGQVALLARNHARTFGSGSINNPEFGMLVVEKGSDKQYAVPFDRNALRMADPATDATPEWAERYFEWQVDSQGQWRLRARPSRKQEPWLARVVDPQLSSNSSRDTRMVLMPVNKHMVSALMDLLTREFGAQPLPDLPEESQLSARFEIEGHPLSLHYYTDRPELHLSASVPVVRTQKGRTWSLSYEPAKIQAANRFIMALTEKINDRLAAGALQEHFTRMAKESY